MIKIAKIEEESYRQNKIPQPSTQKRLDEFEGESS